MAKLGCRQLDHLKTLGPHLIEIVGSPILRSLKKRGLVKALGEDGDSFYCITPDGLRALADAMDDGRVPPMALPKTWDGMNGKGSHG